MADLEAWKKAAAERSLDYVESGMRIGLGTGSTVEHLLVALGERVRAGLDIVAVPTSERTERRARELSIPLTTLDRTPSSTSPSTAPTRSTASCASSRAVAARCCGKRSSRSPRSA